jgi:hypothetical protein
MAQHYQVTMGGLDVSQAPWDFEWIDGWLDTPGIQVPSVERLRHGTFSQRGNWQGRTITVRGTVASEDCDEQQALRDRLAGVFPDGESRRVEVTHGGLTLHGDFQLGDQVQFTPRTDEFSEWSLLLYSEDPFLYGESRSAFAFPPYAGRGLVYPLFSGFTVPAPPRVEHVMAQTAEFQGLMDLFNLARMQTGGGAVLSITDEWPADGGTSLKISAGTSIASAAYLLPRNTPFGDWAGRLLTIDATIYLPEAQPDKVDPSNDPARTIRVGVEEPDASSTLVTLAESTQAPNTPGAHRVHLWCVLPDNMDKWSGWFVRLFNGSTQVPVMWDDVTMTGREIPGVDVSRSTWLQIPGNKVTQSFTIDPTTGYYYVGQPALGEVDTHIWRVDPDGNETGEMLVSPGGHLNQLAVENIDGDVWVWYGWPADFGGAARVKWRPGKVVKDDAEVEYLPTYGVTPLGYSLHGDTVSVADYHLGNRHTTYTLWKRDEYLSGTGTPLAQFDVEHYAHAYQGHTHDDEYVYTHMGGSTYDAITVWRYPWAGDPDGSTSRAGEPASVLSTAGYGQGNGLVRNEAEGIALRPDGTIVFGISGGPTKNRLFSVHDFDPAQFDYLAGWENPDETPPEETTEGGVLTYGEEIQEPDASVRNDGNADAYLTVQAVGDFPGGITITTDVGKGSITYPWPINPGAPLQIDGRGTAWVGNTNVTYQLTHRNFDQLRLAPGQERALSLSPLQGGTGYLQVDVEDTNI